MLTASVRISWRRRSLRASYARTARAVGHRGPPRCPWRRPSTGLLPRVFPDEREAEGIEVVLGDVAEHLLGLRGVARALRRDRELILDVGVKQVPLPEVRDRVLILALIERDESLELVHRLELARVRVGGEQLVDAVGLPLRGGVVAL